MEIVNNQTGQAFALASESAPVSKVASNESSAKASNDSENNSAGQQQANSSQTNSALKMMCLVYKICLKVLILQPIKCLEKRIKLR